MSNKAWILNTSRKHVNYEEDKNNLPMNKPYNIQNTNICNGIFHISFFKALLINEGESRRNDLRGKRDSRRNDSLPLYLANKNMLKLNYTGGCHCPIGIFLTLHKRLCIHDNLQIWHIFLIGQDRCTTYDTVWFS